MLVSHTTFFHFKEVIMISMPSDETSTPCSPMPQMMSRATPLSC